MTAWSRAGVALVVLSLAAACGGGGGSSGPPSVNCGSTANDGVLIVDAPTTCGTAISSTPNSYTFDATVGMPYTVTLITRSGDADLFVYNPDLELVAWSFNGPPVWVDAVTFTAGATGAYTIFVVDFPGTGSSYGIEVTSP